MKISKIKKFINIEISKIKKAQNLSNLKQSKFQETEISKNREFLKTAITKNYNLRIDECKTIDIEKINILNIETIQKTKFEQSKNFKNRYLKHLMLQTI